MNALFCRLPNHVGDCCMTLPALHLLADSGYTPMLFGKRWAEDLMAGTGWRMDPIEGKTWDDMMRLRHLARHIKPAPIGVLFPNSLSSALLFKAAGLKIAGFPTDGRGLLVNYSVPEPGHTHEVERFFAVAHGAIKAWGGTPAYDKCPNTLGLKVLARHEAAARNLIQKHHIPERFALIAPIARGLIKGQQKHWPYFNELCAPLRDRGIEPIVFPSPHEEDLVRKACPNATILPPTTLGTYAALCKRAQVVIANDSGISHVAAAVEARQVTLMGVTDPFVSRPWNPKAKCLGSKWEGWPSLEAALEAIDAVMMENKD